MSKLFEPGRIGGMTLKNRFVRSATWEGMATDEGACTPKLIETLAELAEGGIGLIVTGHAFVIESGKATPRQLGVYDDSLVDGLSELADAVHRKDGKIVLQLAHAGMFASKEEIPGTPVGPSSINDFTDSNASVREMSLDDIRAVQEAFAEGASRAKRAGFDGVQVHAAHGYLLSQFLSPAFNKRADRYGGILEQRARMAAETIEKIREAVGPDYPILIKMNCEDFVDGGLSPDESMHAGRIFEQSGADALEISGGTVVSGKLNPARTGIAKQEDEAYFKDRAVAFRKEVSVPLILVGGIRSPEVAESILENGIADFVSMSRPFIREPGLVERWRSGDRKKAACVSDSKCFVPAFKGNGIQCVVGQRAREKREQHSS